MRVTAQDECNVTMDLQPVIQMSINKGSIHVKSTVPFDLYFIDNNKPTYIAGGASILDFEQAGIKKFKISGAVNKYYIIENK